MKRLLSTAFAVVLLLGLAALAVLARPNGATQMAPAQADSPVVNQAMTSGEKVLPALAKPAAFNQRYNVIAMPLNSQAMFQNQGLTYDADGLAQYIGAAPTGPVQQVLRLNPQNQTYETWLPEFQDGENFPLQTGGVYWILLDSSNPSLAVFSIVGNVPEQGSLHFSLVGNSSACRYNEISIPLDRSDITDADTLATAINNVAGAPIVEQVLRLNASNQTFETWLPEFQDGENFPVKIGYPYHVCLKANLASWP